MAGKLDILSRKFWPLGLINNRTPGQLIIQVTQRCNATCPQCGMNIKNRRPRADLPLNRIKAMIDAAAERGFAAVSFTGGEPLLRLAELVPMISHAQKAGIKYIRTGSNGYFMARPDRPGFQRRVEQTAQALAGTGLRNFWISLDSADPATHEQMRGFPGLVQGLAKALPVFHAHGLYPSVNLGFNRNLGGPATARLRRQPGEPEAEYLARFKKAFSRALAEFYRVALDLGFTMANTCYPMSLSGDDQGLAAIYAASSQERVISFSRAEKAAIFEILLEVVPRFRSKLRIFSPLCSLLALKRQYQDGGPGRYQPFACRGGLDYFFVDAKDGHAYPCGYRGGDGLGPMEALDLAALDRDQQCRRCDWECLRDPSELLGPALQFARRPLPALTRMIADCEHRRLWLADLSYYRACGFFDARQAPNPRRLEKFAAPGPAAQASPPRPELESEASASLG